MASPGSEPPAPQPPTAVTAAALFKLAGECAAAIGACAARRGACGCGGRAARLTRRPVAPRADELEGLTRAARSHREKCAVLLGAALNSKLALEQARPSLRARPLAAAPFRRGRRAAGRADPAAHAPGARTQRRSAPRLRCGAVLTRCRVVAPHLRRRRRALRCCPPRSRCSCAACAPRC